MFQVCLFNSSIRGMMIAPNSCPSEGGDSGGGGRKGGWTGSPTLPQVQLGQGCRMQGTGENMDGGVGSQSTGGAEGEQVVKG